MNLYASKLYLNDLQTVVSSITESDEIKGKSFLITGATGTIGSFLVDTLLEYNNRANATIKIYATSRNMNSLKSRFDIVKTQLLEYIEYDALKSINFDYDIDYIIHAAGNAHPSAFNTDPCGTIVGNIMGTYNLLEYGRRHGSKRFCFVSSGEVYGKGSLKLDLFNESYSGYVDPISPRSCYPNSKRTSETLCSCFSRQYGLETVVVRPCHTFGPTMTLSDSRAHAQFFRNVIEEKDIILKSEGKQIRSYCYVADCVSGIITVLLKGTSQEAYNIADIRNKITIKELAEEIAEYSGKKLVYKNPSKEDVINQTPIEKQVLNGTKLGKLGWSSKFTIKEGVEHTLKILNEQQ